MHAKQGALRVSKASLAVGVMRMTQSESLLLVAFIYNHNSRLPSATTGPIFFI